MRNTKLMVFIRVWSGGGHFFVRISPWRMYINVRLFAPFPNLPGLVHGVRILPEFDQPGHAGIPLIFISVGGGG